MTSSTSNNNQQSHLLRQIDKKWRELENVPNVFRYQLDSQTKVLDGDFHFICQLNPLRTEKRRAPQTISSLNPSYDANAFNFNNIIPDEIMFVIQHGPNNMSFLVNNSPLTEHHCLICPDLKSNYPQILNQSAIEFGLIVQRSLRDRQYRIGYNSPGAWASVNHLHMHLVKVEEDLYIERVHVKHLRRNLHIVDDPSSSPSSPFMFRCRSTDSVADVAADAMRLVRFLCEREIAHNVLITRGRWPESEADEARIFVFPRKRISGAKEFGSFNVAFCELAGFVPVGNKETYSTITEAEIIAQIHADTGDASKDIQAAVIKLYPMID